MRTGFDTQTRFHVMLTICYSESPELRFTVTAALFLRDYSEVQTSHLFDFCSEPSYLYFLLFRVVEDSNMNQLDLAAGISHTQMDVSEPHCTWAT